MICAVHFRDCAGGVIARRNCRAKEARHMSDDPIDPVEYCQEVRQMAWVDGKWVLVWRRRGLLAPDLPEPEPRASTTGD